VADAPILADLLRRPGYFKLLVVCGLVGIPVSVVAFGFLAAEHALTDVFWEDLPDALGLDGAPWWWGIPSLIVAGLIVAFTALRLPGGGGHIPADGIHAGPTQPAHLPGILLAGFASLCLGAVIGPEAILLALGSGAALLIAGPLLRSAEPSAKALVGVSGAFAAIATILGSPLIAAVFMLEAIGFGGAQLFATMLPGLLSAGIGALVFTGLGDWTGFEIQTLGLPPLPDYPRPTFADVLWSLPIAVGCALLAYAIRLTARRVLPIVRARPLLLVPAVGAVVGAAGGAYALITGHPPQEALFSGQQTIGTLISDRDSFSEGDLLVLIACYGFGYAVSLASFRGGPVFPAVMLGVAIGALLGDLPGLGGTPAIAIAMAAMTVSMLRFPVASILLVAILLASSALPAMPIIILAAVTAFIVTELIDPPHEQPA
jgi:chloride channel protein, CIC family